MDPEPFKQVAKMLWSLGDYREISERFQSAARELVDVCKVRPGLEVLDVAAGDGNVAIAAAWRGASVVASDLTPAMVELGKARSADEGVEIEWQEADVEALPFPDERFDVVLSAFGAMFAPRPDVATREMFRVVKPRGTVGMVNWTSDGFIGQLSERTQKFAPPVPPEVPSALLWGDPAVVQKRFEGIAEAINCVDKLARFEFTSVDEMLRFFEHNLGPVVALKSMLADDAYRELMAALRELVEQFNRAGPEVVIDSKYLLVTAEKSAR
jgi:ubiquinone/menaquinone biosynthesis C-methylase UbiE